MDCWQPKSQQKMINPKISNHELIEIFLDETQKLNKTYKYIKQMSTLTHIAGGHLKIPSVGHD